MQNVNNIRIAVFETDLDHDFFNQKDRRSLFSLPLHIKINKIKCVQKYVGQCLSFFSDLES